MNEITSVIDEENDEEYDEETLDSNGEKVKSKKKSMRKMSAKKRMKYSQNAFVVNTSNCRSELELVQYVIFQNGFLES